MAAASDLPIYPFEDTSPDLRFMPLSARRALDVLGRRLSLEGWRSLSVSDRMTIARGGLDDRIDAAPILEALSRSRAPATDIPALTEDARGEPPPELLAALGRERPIAQGAWSGLRPLDRFALLHAHRRAAERGDPERLTVAYDHIFGRSGLSHVGPSGEARMVDVGHKRISRRRAVAEGRVRMEPETARLAKTASGPKGEVVATARLAGIMAAKRTPELIPLCHTIALTRVDVHIEIDPAAGLAVVRSEAEAEDRTGVEMEALVAASVACLTIYDMLKAVDREMVVERVALVEKTGGKADFKRTAPASEGGGGR